MRHKEGKELWKSFDRLTIALPRLKHLAPCIRGPAFARTQGRGTDSPADVRKLKRRPGPAGNFALVPRVSSIANAFQHC